MEILFNIDSFSPAINAEMYSVMLTFKKALKEYLKDIEITISMQQGIIVVNLIPGKYSIQYLYGGSWDDWADKIQEMLSNFDKDKFVLSKHNAISLN